MAAMPKFLVALTTAVGLAGCVGAAGPAGNARDDEPQAAGAARGETPAQTATPSGAGVILTPIPLTAATLERLRTMRGPVEEIRSDLRKEVRSLESELAAESTGLPRKVEILTRLREMDRRLAETETRLAAIDRAMTFARDRSSGFKPAPGESASGRF